MNTNFIDIATRAMIGSNIPSPVDLMQDGLVGQNLPYQAVKASQFSWTRLAGADPMLGVEMASTGII